MNLFAADPEWGWWIVLYFFCGGLAAGLYFLAALIALFGHEDDAPLVRTSHLLAFPLIALCGIFLTVDLNRPERFWHMLFQSEVVEQALDAGWPLSGAAWGLLAEAPLLKVWSPMSIGALAVGLFGLFSFLSFLAALQKSKAVPHTALQKSKAVPHTALQNRLLFSVFGKVYQVLGAAVGFFVASYTGVLLTASNQPVWAGSEWIGALFLTSAASTGIAVLLLLTGRSASGGRKSPDGAPTPGAAETLERLEKAELWAVVLELAVFLIFLGSLGPALFLLTNSWHGRLLVFGTLLLGMIVPLYLQVGAQDHRRPTAAALSTLAGGLVLRYALLFAPGEVLAAPHSLAVGTDTWTAAWGWFFLASMLILLAMISMMLYRRMGPSPGHRSLSAGFFVVAGLLLALHTCTTYDQRQDFWSALPVHLSPELGRQRGGGVGASELNRPEHLQPKSKVFTKE